MEIVDVALEQLKEAPWNPNRMDEATIGKLRLSMTRFGLVQNLVVRPIGNDSYEVLSGNQRLKLLRELGLKTAPCLIVDLDEALARLLAQTLNRLQGDDDIGLKAELLKKVLDSLTREDVLAVLPETAGNLQALASLNHETIAEHLHAWQQAQGVRLRHFQVQLTANQLELVEKALARILPQAKNIQSSNPNSRGNALFLLCKTFLEKSGKECL